MDWCPPITVHPSELINDIILSLNRILPSMTQLRISLIEILSEITYNIIICRHYLFLASTHRNSHTVIWVRITNHSGRGKERSDMNLKRYVSISLISVLVCPKYQSQSYSSSIARNIASRYRGAVLYIKHNFLLIISIYLSMVVVRSRTYCGLWSLIPIL